MKSSARRLILLLPVFALLAALAVPLPPATAQDSAGNGPVGYWDGVTKKAEVDAAVAEYFKADTTDRRRREIREMLDGLGFATDATIGEYTRKLFGVIRQGVKIDAAAGTWEHGDLKGKIYISGNTSGQNQPLFIALHGGGEGSGDGRNALGKWKQFTGIVIAPTAPELRHIAWNFADIEEYVLELIEAAKRTWSIDTNKIYMGGHSMGGYGTWCLGGRHADRFAGLTPSAAGGRDPHSREHQDNMLNTPIWIYHSDNDPVIPPDTDREADKRFKELKEQGYPYEWVYDEQRGRGHGLPAGGHTKQLTWIQERTRNPYPNWIVWEPSREKKKLFNWIYATDTYSNNEYDISGKMMQIGRVGRIEAKIDGQIVSVKEGGDNGKIGVFLCEHLVNVHAPVTIVHNGEQIFAGQIKPRLSALLHSLWAHRDPKQYYTHVVWLDDPYGGMVEPKKLSDEELKLELLKFPENFGVEDQKFEEVISLVSAKIGLPIYIDPGAVRQLRNKRKITRQFKDESYQGVIGWLCEQKGVRMQIIDGTIWIMPGSGQEAPEPEPEVEEIYPKGTKEFETFMKYVEMIVPRGHHVLRKGTSVSGVISDLNENYQDKVQELVTQMSRRVRGEERDLLREFRDMLEASDGGD